MADITLKTDYKDDVLDTSVNERRKYQMIQNGDGTVSFVDVTEYSQVGDSFGGADINATNGKINELNTNLISVKEYKDYTIDNNCYARKHYLDVTLYFDGYEITEGEFGNGGNVGTALIPLFNIYFPVFISGVEPKVCCINTDGIITLYSNDFSTYETGSIKGTVSYKTLENNL